MHTILGLSLLASVSVSTQTPHQEYETYLAQYKGSTLISGALTASGGPVNQPTIATFRVWNGGMYAVYKANREEHYDGKSAFMFAPVENSYIPTSASSEPFEVIFGPRFGSGDVKKVVESAKDGVYGDRSARVFGFKLEEGQSPSELFIDKKTRKPLALMFYSQQASFAIEVTELHLRTRTAPFTPWAPPKGAVKVEFLPDR